MATPTKRIGTHSGQFHCDEALACFLLHQTAEFAGAEIIRTRDSKILDTLDILVDVGAVYDPKAHRYDHHQAGFFETLDENHKIKLSSAGLVYKHFGKEVIQKLAGTTPEITEIIYQHVYTNFVEALDASDNGINQYEVQTGQRFRITTGLGSRVGRLNPAWNEEDTLNPDDQFKKAMEMAGSEFLQNVSSLVNTWLPARSLVEQAVQESVKYGEACSIAVLPRACPWKEHLFELEKELGIQGRTQYMLFSADGAGDWRIQSVPLLEDSFDNRAPLPEAWRGRRDAELSGITGIEGCIFTHANGFIGGNKTFEGVLAMAKAALAHLGKK